MKKFFAGLIFSLLLLLSAGVVFGAEGDLCCKDSDCGPQPEWLCKCDPSTDPPCQLNPDGTKVVQGRAGICVRKGSEVICPATPLSITEILENIIKWMLYIAMVVAPIMLIIGAIVFMTSIGDPYRRLTAQRIITWTIIGFVIILFSRGIFSIIKGILLGGG